MDNSDMFTVTPMSKKIMLDAGEVYEGDIIVANPANATNDFIYKVEVMAYTVKDENYVADFLTDSERTKIVDWITVDNPTGVLAPNETVKVHYTVRVPETAPAGGQYAAFLISSGDTALSSDGISVNNIFEMASILYAQVNGEITRGGEILGNTVSGFVTKGPIMTTATLRNDGNVHETARIALEVRSYLSAGTIYPRPGETGAVEEIIMPETTRFVTREITDVSPLGIYDVLQTVSYMGATSVTHQVVVACPVWFMALVLLTTVAIITAITFSAKRRRNKKLVF